MTETTGLLLAAGLSTRFGVADKLLAPLDGVPLVLHAARTLASSNLSRLLAVTSSAAVADLLEPLGYQVHVNDMPEDGLGSSVAIGAQAAAGTETRLLVMLADMPRVSAVHLERLLASGAPVTATGGGPRPMPPALFAAHIVPSLARLAGPDGARSLLAHAALVAADPLTLIDVDTPTALSRLSYRSA